MDSKATGIIAYLSWIGLIISVVAGAKDDEFAKFHQNQALVIFLGQVISGVLCFILIGYLTSLVLDYFKRKAFFFEN